MSWQPIETALIESACKFLVSVDNVPLDLRILGTVGAFFGYVLWCLRRYGDREGNRLWWLLGGGLLIALALVFLSWLADFGHLFGVCADAHEKYRDQQCIQALHGPSGVSAIYKRNGAGGGTRTRMAISPLFRQGTGDAQGRYVYRFHHTRRASHCGPVRGLAEASGYHSRASVTPRLNGPRRAYLLNNTRITPTGTGPIRRFERPAS
jgi:hypothetical protein